ncbi:aminopeptidase N [Arenicella chitinivorans]|uniref:Aminopeptidase n=1 Tax=Arenicella chitinivorans TaxID=1329800 RepID=A0A918RV47_9GAMM|nr:M1 family metallopeptidase [Arenicella chitinivorans]GHA13716.1 aminopeptidase N [Arenicella chitinivorans]
MKYLTLFFALVVFSVSVHAESSAYRVSDDVTPEFQAITLTLDPDVATFQGNTQIHLVVAAEVSHIEFYQSGLVLDRVVLTQGDQVWPMTVEAAQHDIQHASTGATISPGNYVLKIAYQGKINNTSDGAYVSRFDGRNYISTQFEDMHARKAFPGIDEPDAKIPYQVTISAPEKHVVLSNTPVQKRVVNDGVQTVQFEKTKPMPSYLVAFAVGEFDSVPIPGLSIPGRIYTPKGQAQEALFAAERTAEILHYLEAYFGQPYPYKKLDFVAVPTFTHGAMENVGLVTYRSEILLRGQAPVLAEQSTPLMVIAHELAHMWYGNLVTMAWWDDLWLNEAFASFMAARLMQDLYPEHNYKTRLVAERAFGPDAAETTKPVKKTVRVAADVMDGLGLNYSKGEAILHWIESQIGSAAFQSAVRDYMAEFAWRNAKADDLWRVLSNASKTDVGSMMRTYLEQPSYPMVDFNAKGQVQQRRYHLTGADVPDQGWTVPLSLKLKRDGEIVSQQVLLNAQRQTFPALAGADWIYPNTEANGYYRWRIPSNQLAAMLMDLDALTVREKKALLYNSEALLNAGELGFTEFMTVLEALSAQKDPAVARSVVSVLAGFEYLIDSNNEAAFGNFVESRLIHWFNALGTVDREQDSDDQLRLRHSAFGLLSTYSDNADVHEAAAHLATGFLSSPQLEQRQMAARALRAVAQRGDEKWLVRYEKALTASRDANVKSVIQRALNFKGEKLMLAVLDLAMGDTINPADTMSVISAVVNVQDDPTPFYAWLSKNLDALANKIPDYHVTRIPQYVSRSCDTDTIQLADALYSKVASSYEGMTRGWEIAKASSEQCVNLKQRHQAAFDAYLESVAAAGSSVK